MAVIVGKTGMSAGRTGSWCLRLYRFGKTEVDLVRLTEFDRKTWGELHLNKLPEFIKVLEGRNHLQNIQQPETKRAVTGEKGCAKSASGRRRDSRFDAQREVLTHGDCGFEVFLVLFADQLPPEMRGPEETQTEIPGSAWKSGIYVQVHQREPRGRTFRCRR